MSRVFWINLILAAGFVLLLGFITLQVIRSYTDHNGYVTVPDCTGLSFEQAVKSLERQELAWEIMDSLYEPRELPLVVLGQYPTSGSEVKRERIVMLTINKSTPPMVEVPVEEVLEKTLRSVQYSLQGKGFEIGELIYKPGVYDNQVLELREGGKSEAIEAGTELVTGSVIDLVVTDGFGNTRAELPDFRGMSLEEARFLISANNFVEGIIVFDTEILSADDSLKSRVYRQSFADQIGEYVRAGSMIDLWMGFPDTTQVNNPDLEDSMEIIPIPVPE